MNRRPGFDFTRWAYQPALIFTVVFFGLPLATMVVVSFWQRIYGKLTATWTFANYNKFFGKDYLVDALWNSIEVTLATTAISIILAYPLAYILAYRVPARWQRFVLILTVLPFWTAYVVRSYSWLLVISKNGILNIMMTEFGLIDQPLEMAYSRGATILGFVHFFTMLLTLTIYANLVQIKPSYRKAAADLGASPLQVFLRITLPLSIPGVAVGAFITFVICIGDFITRAANFPMASVMSITLMVVVVGVYFMSAKHLKMERV